MPRIVDSSKPNVWGALFGCAMVFWDFDGVIKESLDVKTDAYGRLFSAYGLEIVNRVKAHHEANGGVSRFEKIPLYLDWAGLPCDKSRIEQFCLYFSEAVRDAVVDSPWVPGVHRYILDHFKRQIFVLVTATPQQEIEFILKRLQIAHCFWRVYGAPICKKDAIAMTLEEEGIDAKDALMIGDSETDLLAAKSNQVDFLLRQNKLNLLLQSSYKGQQFKDLI